MRITNVTELIWSDALESLLRMCGEKENMIGGYASDYQRFFALCQSAHLLRGNPLIFRISCFLSEMLRHPVVLSAENAALLWKESAELFLVNEGASALWETFYADMTEEIDSNVCPRRMLSDFFEADFLLQTTQKSWEAWRDEMKEICENAFQADDRGIRFTLPESFAFHSPHPYGVGLALMKHKKDAQAQNLLVSQLFRFLSEECAQRGRSLFCRVECDGSEAVRLFSYAEGQVGLPLLIWCLAPSRDPAALITFSGRYHPNPVECALQRGEYSTAATFGEALQTYAKSYPLGRLFLFES